MSELPEEHPPASHLQRYWTSLGITNIQPQIRRLSTCLQGVRRLAAWGTIEVITAVEQQYLDQTRSIIAKYLDPKQHRAYLIGSRAVGTAQQFSDIDIAIDGPRLKSSVYFEMLHDFEESSIPYLVDIVQLCDVSEDFKQVASVRIPLN